MIKEKVKCFLKRFAFDGDKVIQSIYFVFVLTTILSFCTLNYVVGISVYFCIGFLVSMCCLPELELRNFLCLICGWIYYFPFSEKF